MGYAIFEQGKLPKLKIYTVYFSCKGVKYLAVEWFIGEVSDGEGFPLLVYPLSLYTILFFWDLPESQSWENTSYIFENAAKCSLVGCEQYIKPVESRLTNK